jgi:hypothetical protein
MTFNNHAAKQILSVPIYVTLPIENVIWHWERMETIQLNQPTIFCVKREIPLYGYFQCWKVLKIYGDSGTTFYLKEAIWKRNIFIWIQHASFVNLLWKCWSFVYKMPKYKNCLTFVQLGIYVPSQMDIGSWMRILLATPNVLVHQLFDVTLWMVEL